VLESQKFFPAQNGAKKSGNVKKTHSFVFENCIETLAAIRKRQPEVIALAKAVAIGEFEIGNQYVEAKHDSFFEEYGDSGLDAKDLALFPDYLVCLSADNMQAAENDRVMEILSEGLPVKILVQSDDILEERPHLALGMRSKQLASMAMGLNDIYVLQASGSHLFQFRDRILKGLRYPGSAVFSVFSGATSPEADLPPYLIAAAAMDSRAFPAYTFDPSAGPNWASRFYLESNSQVDLDWPVQRVAYEDEAHQRIAENVTFTLVDFVACDHRYVKHLARVPRHKWNGSLLPVGEFLTRELAGLPDKVPCLLMVDADNVLQKVIVDDKLVREAIRCRETWHSLQELGGIHNSHAERLIARERKTWEEQEQQREIKSAPAAAPAAPVSTAAPTAAAAIPKPAEAAVEPEPPSDEAYIETPRCTTCEECVNINNKMFVYDDNKQAYIANREAGTYAQLVEAAESCQVSIIHPGKPWNLNEPGLDELIKRAAVFS
jgi:ferredoxin